ncbi:MAG TPA: hypothetical protein VLF43_00590 [Candidatus Saccharimonadales bacterium]|nr:hypothetical protein [Candidatus Saccharimonadales bacterium]
MGFLDDLRSDMGDEARERYEELKHREASGDLDDQSRVELNQLRERFETSDNP